MSKEYASYESSIESVAEEVSPRGVFQKAVAVAITLCCLAFCAFQTTTQAISQVFSSIWFMIKRKSWLPIWATMIASASTQEKAIVMPVSGTIVGLQLGLSQTNAINSGSSCFVGQTSGITLADGAPVLGHLYMLTTIAGATYGYQNSSAIYIPQNFRVAGGQILYGVVTDTGATSTGYFLIQLEPD